MKKWLLGLQILVTFLIAIKANGQSIVNTYTDPCDGKVYSITTPIPNQVVVAVVRGQAKTFTYAEVISGAMTTWINTIFSQPCPVSVTQTIAQQAAQAASSAASQAASTAASAASSSAASAVAASTPSAPTSSSTSSSSQPSSSSSQQQSSSGGSSSSQEGSSGSGESSSSKEGGGESKSESKSEKKSESKSGDKKKKQEEKKANPPIVKADLSVIQIGTNVIPTLNINLSKSLNEGTFSWGLNTSLRADLKQLVVGGSTSNLIMKKGKLFGVSSTSVTFVTDWRNKFIFYGWSFVKPLEKGAVTGLALSGNTLMIARSQLMISPSIIAFYTRPYQISKKQVISPEIYLISSPLMFGQQDKKITGDPNISIFTGGGTDVQFSKRFKLNMNFKVNISTNPNVPVMSVLSLGSKINI